MTNIFRNTKPIIGIIAIIIIVIILVLVLIPSSEDDIDEQKVYSGPGPKINLQAITTGNTFFIPELGHTAVYGIYANNIKAGEITFTTEKEEIFQKIECYKIIGSGSMSYTSMDPSYEFYIYISKSNNTLVYSEYVYHYNGEAVDINMTMSFDEETGEITVKMIDQETVLKNPEAYWEFLELFNNLYVGLEKELTFTTFINGNETETYIKITVPKKEDVIVPAGLFEDCYRIQMEKNESGSKSITIIWINDSGVTPKCEVSMSMESSILVSVVSDQLIDYF